MFEGKGVRKAIIDLCSDVLNSEECQTKSFSLLNVRFFQSHFQILYHQRIESYNIHLKKLNKETEHKAALKYFKHCFYTHSEKSGKLSSFDKVAFFMNQ